MKLGAHASLGSTVEFFRSGNAGGRSPFRRESLAADVGWSARHVLLGEPSPLLQEVRAINPRYAFVLAGGNDVEGREPRRYANRLLRIIDQLLVRGVIPIVGSILPRRDSLSADRWVARYNVISRAIADGRRVPYIDFYRALSALPRRGLAGDGVHPNVLVVDGATRPCHLTGEGLRHGHNQRNLLAIQALDRLHRVLDLGDSVLRNDEQASATWDEPYPIKVLPFGRLADTRRFSTSRQDSYDCDPEADESGPEHVYQLQLVRPRRLRFWANGPSGADVDVHILSADDRRCVARDDELLTRTLAPGNWWVVVDTFSGDAAAGEYVLAIEEVAGELDDAPE